MVPEANIKALYDALDLLEIFLKSSEYLVGSNLTLADISCLTTITAYELHFPIDASRYPTIRTWIEWLSALPFYDEN